MPVNINTVGTSGIGSSGGSSCSLINDISVETKFHINGGFSFNDGFIRNSLIGTNTSFKYRQDDLYKYNKSYPSYTFYMNGDFYRFNERCNENYKYYDFVHEYTCLNDLNNGSGLFKGTSSAGTTGISIGSSNAGIYFHSSLLHNGSIIMAVSENYNHYFQYMEGLKIIKYDGKTQTVLVPDALTTIYQAIMKKYGVSTNGNDTFYGLFYFNEKYYFSFTAYSYTNVYPNGTSFRLCELDDSFNPVRWYDTPSISNPFNESNNYLCGSSRWNTFVGEYMYTRTYSRRKDPNTSDQVGTNQGYKLGKHKVSINNGVVTLTYQGVLISVDDKYNSGNHEFGQLPCNSLCEENHAIIGGIMYDNLGDASTIGFHKDTFEAYIDPLTGSLIEHKICASNQSMMSNNAYVNIGIVNSTISAYPFYDGITFNVDHASSLFRFCFANRSLEITYSPFTEFKSVGSDSPYATVSVYIKKYDTVYSNGTIVSVTDLNTNSTKNINKNIWVSDIECNACIIINGVDSHIPMVYIADVNGYLFKHEFVRKSDSIMSGSVIAGMRVNDDKITTSTYDKTFAIPVDKRFYVDMKGVS